MLICTTIAYKKWSQVYSCRLFLKVDVYFYREDQEHASPLYFLTFRKIIALISCRDIMLDELVITKCRLIMQGSKIGKRIFISKYFRDILNIITIYFQYIFKVFFVYFFAPNMYLIHIFRCIFNIFYSYFFYIAFDLYFCCIFKNIKQYVFFVYLWFQNQAT